MKLFVQESAELDVLHQVEWYAKQGLIDVAQRFSEASVQAINSLVSAPEAGSPRYIDNPKLQGLRTWSVKGFDEFRVYYILHADLLIVVRILHSKRDTDAILEGQDVDDLGEH